MNAVLITSLLVAALDLVVAVTIVVYSRRERSALSTLTVLMAAFFVLRAAARAIGLVFGYEHALEAVIDIALLVLLLLLAVRAKDLATGLSRAASEAELRRSEYERALDHYSKVVRHRIANPLAVVTGAAQTLAGTPTDPATHKALVQSIIDAATVIEQESFDPRRGGPEEHELDALPSIPR